MNKRYMSALLSKGNSPSAIPLSEEIIGEEIAEGDISSSLTEETIVASPIEEQTIQAEEITTPSINGVLGVEIENFLASDVNEIAPRLFELSSNEDMVISNEIKALTIEGFICAGAFEQGGESHNTNTRYKIVQDDQDPYTFSLYSRELDSTLWVLVSTITIPVVQQISDQTHADDTKAASVGAVKDYVEQKRTMRQYPSVSEFPIVGDENCMYIDISTSYNYYYDVDLGIYKRITVDAADLNIDYIYANFS